MKAEYVVDVSQRAVEDLCISTALNMTFLVYALY